MRPFGAPRPARPLYCRGGESEKPGMLETFGQCPLTFGPTPVDVTERLGRDGA